MFLIMHIRGAYFRDVSEVLIGHDARIAPSSDSRNVSKISSSDMHIYSSQVLIFLLLFSGGGGLLARGSSYFRSG